MPTKMLKDRRSILASEVARIGHEVESYVIGKGPLTKYGIIKSVSWRENKEFGELYSARFHNERHER